MRVQDNVGKISWTVADKVLFIAYGFVALLQIRVLPPSEIGLYSLLIGLQTWIFIVSDGAALQGIIQFGMNKSDRAGVHTVALVTHILLTLGISAGIALCAGPLSHVFHEPRFADVALWLPVFCVLTIPRTFCLKVLLRDSQMKQVFWTNFAWFGTMTVMTAWMILNHSLTDFSGMATISCAGIGVSSLVSVILAYKLVPLTLRNLPSLSAYYRFGVVQIGIAGVTNAVRQLDILLLQFSFHDLSFLGMYYSAKTFFRVFETGLDALFSIIYPTAIRLLPERKDEEFTAVLTKGVSYLFLAYVAAVVVLELGGTTLLVSILGGKYVNVTGQFNTMVLAALFLPFASLYSVLLAENRNVLMLLYVCIGTVCGAAVFILSGILRQQWMFPLGIVVYNAVVAMLLYGAVKSRLGLRISMFFRAIPDVLNYLRHLRSA